MILEGSRKMLVLTQLDQLQSDLVSGAMIDDEDEVLKKIEEIKEEVRKI